MLLTQHWFWYPRQQMKGINGTPKTLGRYYKRRIKPSTKGTQQQLIKAKKVFKKLCKGS